jgi:hypothetical protein
MNDLDPTRPMNHISYEYFTPDETLLNLLATYHDLMALVISGLPIVSTPSFTRASMNLR